jgi:hypothetical protein
MTKTAFPTVPLESLTPANIGHADNEWGRKALADYVARRKKYLGRVLAVVDVDGLTVRRGFDDHDYVKRRTVWVWDSTQSTPKITYFVSDEVDNGNTAAASGWAVDATPDVVAASRKWQATVEVTERAEYAASEARKAEDSRLVEAMNALTNPRPRRGQLYEVVGGRKFPKGLRGVLFWAGSNKWGESYGLATSDRKLPNGRNADVIFINPKNLQAVLDDASKKALEDLREQRKQLDSYEQDAYAKTVATIQADLAKAWGVSLNAVVARTVAVVTDEIAAQEKRMNDISENHWACDGPAYSQVERECEARTNAVKRLSRLLKAIKPEVAVAVAA